VAQLPFANTAHAAGARPPKPRMRLSGFPSRSRTYCATIGASSASVLAPIETPSVSSTQSLTRSTSAAGSAS